MSSVFTATAGWIDVEMTQGGGWSVVRDSTGQAAAWRGTGSGIIGADDPSVGLERVLREVGIEDDEARILARVIVAGGDVG